MVEGCTGKSKILSLMAMEDEKAQLDEWKKIQGAGKPDVYIDRAKNRLA